MSSLLGCASCLLVVIGSLLTAIKVMGSFGNGMTLIIYIVWAVGCGMAVLEMIIETCPSCHSQSLSWFDEDPGQPLDVMVDR